MSGESFKQKADKKATSTSSFSFFSSSNSKYEEAHELYISAGNAYKMEKQWKESGDCFCKAGEMSLKGEEKDDAANDFWTASKSYKKTHPECKFFYLSLSSSSRYKSCDFFWTVLIDWFNII